MIKYMYSGILACLIVAIVFSQAFAESERAGVVSYSRDFFAPYNPSTALDMIDYLPGFALDEGDNVRGFEAAAGNVLINGERPTAKSKTLSEILAQIPAISVERIDVTRGGAASLNAARQDVVANIVLIARQGQLNATYALNGSTLAFARFSYQTTAALSGRSGPYGFNVGIERLDEREQSFGLESVTAFFEPDEFRDELQLADERRTTLNAELTHERIFGGELRINGQGEWGNARGGEDSFRTPAGEPAFLLARASNTSFHSFETGANFEHPLGEGRAFRLITLVNREVSSDDSSRAIPEISVSRRTAARVKSGETILRGELDWRVHEKHLLQFGSEAGRTFIESDFEFFEDNGGGEIRIEAPGANSRVEERRAEAFISDSWNMRPNLQIDIRYAAEVSEIDQTGDINNKRTFFFHKPQVGATYNRTDNQQWRIRLERIVSQLDFEDFISSNDFDDNEFEFGNPELAPDRRWRTSVELEQRFGEIGIVEIGLFHESIKELVDLLPLGGMFEVPGNIGGATVFGATIEGTAPLEFIGLKNARLEFDARGQHTSVTDPVTGQDRRLSNERGFRYDVEYRQTIIPLRANYGFAVSGRTSESFFGLDELERDGGFVEISAFAEIPVSKNAKFRFDAGNLTNVKRTSQRTAFLQSRTDGGIDFIERRSRQRGRFFAVTLAGQL